MLVITLTTFSDGEFESETDLENLDEQDFWYATDDIAEYEAMIGPREARKKLQHAMNIEKVLPRR